MNNVLPFGTLNTKTFRTFTTVSLAALMPFRAQEICHENGIYYGLNALSKNLIIADKLQLLNANEFILGVPGSGKSFTAKREILLRKLIADKKTDIIIIDPEREYTALVKALGGSVIQISATSNNHINAMDINSEYYEKIQEIQNGIDNLDNTTITINGEVGGMTGVWQDVLAVYAVDMSHGEEASVAIDFDESKTQQLRDIFWDMVSISYSVIERTEEEEQEVTDESGNVMTEVVEITYRDVKISVKTKSATEAAEMYSFTDEQNDILTELMSDQFTESWSKLIYGYSFADEDIVAVAISQIGNVGGEPYWRWYGLSSRTEWCAIFVSWCADQCGYIDSGIVPKFAWVPDGVSWFQARGQWRSGGYTPSPGDIIFFDWDNDGKGNHVGIVEYVENNVVHTVEGNSGDKCKKKICSKKPENFRVRNIVYINIKNACS